MKIAVISDTHMPKKAKQLPSKLIDGLQEVDLILHAGDWQTLNLYHQLSTFAPVEGVAGNVDGDDVHEFFGREKVLEIKHIKIGLTHGDGKRKTTEKRAIDAFVSDNVDVIIYGHSHIPVLKQMDDTIIFNPGSPTDKRRQACFSYGVIEIGQDVQLKHVFFESKD